MADDGTLEVAGDDGAQPQTGAGDGKAQTVGQTEPILNKYFKTVIKMKVSDLHLKADRPAMIRMKGDIRALQSGPLNDEFIRKGIFELLNEDQKAIFKEMGAVDFAHDVGPRGDSDRFRVNVFQQRGKMSVAARRVDRSRFKFEDLHLPPVMAEISEFNEGMVLLAGITGSGKSTTIASMINYINERWPLHIVTIEDPIEYLFDDDKCLINQREIGIDVPSFSAALKYLMREDPDVVLIGELRDIDTFSAAVHAAETGHLVFGTIHASSSAQTISRILDLFPESERRAIRQALEFNLKSVVCQKLIPCVKEGVPLVPTVEIMIVNASIRKLIREERDSEILNVIRASYDAGMVDFTESLRELVDTGYIDHETAYDSAPNPDELKMALKGIRQPVSGLLG